MRRAIVCLLSLMLMAPLTVDASATTKVGSICQKMNDFIKSDNRVLVCTKVNKKLIWKFATAAQSAKFNAKAAADAKAAAEAKTVADAKAAADAKALLACPLNSKSITVGILFDFEVPTNSGVFDSGGRNASAAKGIEWLKACGMTIKKASLASGTDVERQEKLHLLAAGGANPIIAVSFLSAGPIKTVAMEYPKVQFAITDDSSVSLANVAGLVFAEDQGSYLAGVAAALASKSGKVGFIGSIRIPLIQKYEQGFVAGVNSANSNISVEVKYMAEFPDFSGFNDPAKAKVVASEMISLGVDVIYGAAGNSQSGIVDLARDLQKSTTKFWIIGTETDLALKTTQTGNSADMDSSKSILTSMVKNIDIAVFNFVINYAKSGFVTELIDSVEGIRGHRYTLSEGGVSLSTTGGNLNPYSKSIQLAINLYTSNLQLAEKAAAAEKAAIEAAAAAEKVAAEKAAAEKVAAEKAAAENAAIDALATEKLAAEKLAAEKKASETICSTTTVRLKVGIAYELGGLGDKSFNDSTAAGLSAAKAHYCISSTEESLTTGSDAEREGKLRSLAKAGNNPIIAVGFLYASPIKAVAIDYPSVHFAIIDDESVNLLNVASLVFAEEQGSYLAGVAAALASKSGKVGYIGGVRIPLLQKFEAGFVAGAKATNSEIVVDARYVTEFPDFSGFNDPAKAKVIAKGMIDRGVDVIYSAAGASGAGNFAAAAEAAFAGKKVWTIGSDTDQYLTVSAAEKKNMLTSMIKRIDTAVYDVIAASAKGTSVNDVLDAKYGVYGRVYTVARDGVGLSYSGGYLTNYKDQLEKVAADIKSGKILVPTKP